LRGTVEGLRITAKRLPASLAATALTSFLFLLSLFYLILGIGGTALVSFSVYYIASPLSPILYQFGVSPSMSLFCGALLSGTNALLQIRGKRHDLESSAALSGLSATMLFITAAIWSDPYNTFILYAIAVAYLSILPLSQLSLHSYTLLQKLSRGIEREGSGRKEAGKARTSNIDDMSLKIDILEREIEKPAASPASSMDREKEAVSVQSASMNEITEQSITPVTQKGDHASPQVDGKYTICAACGSRTPSRYRRCRFCGLPLKGNAATEWRK